MTTASVPATSSERRNPLFQNTKNRIASLSSKNEEILDQINRLQHSHSQTLTVINSQLETFPHTNDSGQHIDNLVNNLKSRQRRSNSLQQQSISSVLKSDKLSNGKDLVDIMDVENDYEINETKTITADDSLSSRKSAKLAIANRTIKELKKNENLTPNNNGGELDWKYFSAENNSDSENGNGNTSSMEDKDFENMNDNNSRRRIPKSHPTLTINTNTTKSSHRLITPESSDSEFDMSNAHMPLAPTLGGVRNPLRVARHSSAEHYNIERRGRSANSLYSSMDGVIEEERGALSDVAEQSEINNTSENINRIRGKQITSINGRKRAQKYLDDYNAGIDASKVIKMHRRPHADDSFADIPDDNSSAMSTDSFIQLEVEELRARIQKLESERVDDENMSERKSQRRKKHYADSIMSPAALSPDSSQGGASSTTSFSRHSSASAQHQKHLQNAFDMFEKAFTADQSTNDSSPPPSHSMAMVVSSALSLNQRLRSVMTQMELDGQVSEKGLKALLKTSDEQVRSLTECLLALAPLAPKRIPTKKVSGERDQLGIRVQPYYPSDSSLLQMPIPSHSTRSISPIPRTSSAPVLVPHESQIGEHVDQSSSRRVSPTPPSDQSSPPNSYYIPPRTTRYNRLSRPSSPTLQPEDSQISASRERKLRRSSGTAYNPPPPTHYDQPGVRAYYERETPREVPRELPRLQRYSLQGYNNASPQSTTLAYQRTSSRPSSHIRIDESSHPLSNHARTSSASSISSISSIHRSSSGRSYASRVTSEEYVNSPVSATRSQPPSRLYEYTRRYPSDGQSPIDRRPTPGLETDRRYSRRIVNQYEPEDSYDGPNVYGENVSERDYIRDDKTGIRNSISNSSNTYRQRMVPAQEQEVNCNAGVVVEENRSENNRQDDDINHDSGQNVQVNCSNVEKGEVNGYI